MRAYTLQATKLKKDGFPRFVKTGKGILVLAWAMEKLEGLFLARMGQNFQSVLPNNHPSKS